MLNQELSIDDSDCAEGRVTALSPLPSHSFFGAVDPHLKARLSRAAAALALPSPVVMPGAAALLLPLHLPLNSARKRRAAAPFGAEESLATPVEHAHVAVGPHLGDDAYLCAAASHEAIADWASAHGTGVLVPDLCAVPIPPEEGIRHIWCATDAVYVRTNDGGGCVVGKDSFADIWRATGRPKLWLIWGAPPQGVEIAHQVRDIPDVDPSVFQLDLHPNTRGAWRGRLRFAAVLAALTVLAHTALLQTDARALEALVTERSAAIQDDAVEKGVALDLRLPTQALTGSLARSARTSATFDPFLAMLSSVGGALAGQNGLAFRTVNYEATSGTVTLLVSAPDLDVLQKVENRLRAAGIVVTGGAATRTAAGAEMQLILSGGV